MAAFQTGFVDHGTTIGIVANLPLGWCYAGRNEHRFHMNDTLAFHALEARIHFDVRSSPDTAELPALAAVRLRTDQGLQWEMSGNILRLYAKMHHDFELNPELPWENTGRKNCIVWRQTLGISDGHHVSAKLVIAFDWADRRKAGDVIEWDTQFCQGGLPTLGRRR